MMMMQTTRLVFHPQQPQQAIDYPQLLRCLKEIEYIETESEHDGNFLPGNQFLSLLTFLGCSPSINLTPTEGEKHCSIRMIDEKERAVCLGHTQTAKPKCPDCKKRIGTWKDEYWQQPDQQILCDKCQAENTFSTLNWKHECGYARGGFEVVNIYPHEAVPTEQFLDALHQYTGFAWSYCYAYGDNL